MNEYQPGEEAGIKSATFTVSGEYAYGFCRARSACIGWCASRRLIRPSAAILRLLAYSSSPEIDETIEVDIKPDDMRIDTYRSGGKGGQHVNTTDSAVRITHLPTGIVVQLPERTLAAQESRDAR